MGGGGTHLGWGRGTYLGPGEGVPTLARGWDTYLGQVIPRAARLLWLLAEGLSCLNTKIFRV